MKIMLKQDVHGTGKAGDIVTVSDGYASNFLIPQRFGRSRQCRHDQRRKHPQTGRQASR